MKKNYLILSFLLSALYAFADGEKICVVTNTGSSGKECSATNLGFIDPCSNIPFIVDYNLPQGFVIVAKYEWFVNSISVKTTTDPTDPLLNWQIKSKTTTVLCKVTYKKQDGTLSDVYISTSFTPNVKQLNFPDNGITTSTAPPNFGCTTNAVSYSLNTFICTGNLCSSVYNVSQYSITWQPPSGWTQTSISTNGNNVSFLPDANTGGVLSATITLPCGYTDTRSLTINRIAEKPTFSSSNSNTVCTSTESFAINPTCGAVNYTYTIVGSTGITFTSNGQQTLTASSSSPNLSFSGNSSIFILKAKANYSGSNVSAEASTEVIYGTPARSITTFEYDPCGTYVSAGTEPVDGAIRYIWNLDYIDYETTLPGIYLEQGVEPYPFFHLSANQHFLRLQVENACGISDYSSSRLFTTQDCILMLSVSPNPSGGTVEATLSEKGDKTKKKDILEIRIIDKMGNIKQNYKYGAGVKNALFDVSALSPDVYTIIAFDGKTWTAAKFMKN